MVIENYHVKVIGYLLRPNDYQGGILDHARRGGLLDRSQPPEVVDLFCGVGALSHGLKQAGCNILAGYDVDRKCKFAFEENNGGRFYTRDVSQLLASEVASHYSGNAIKVLAGCAPCQPFSTYKHRYAEDPQWGLVGKFAQLAVEVRPDFVTMENVPALLKYKDGLVFRRFRETLKEGGYDIRYMIARCERFGVPQLRRRLVVLASLNHKLPPLPEGENGYTSVREAIASLPKLNAGETCPTDPLHVSSSLSKINLERIQLSKPGGTWRDWPEALRADCHKKPSGKTYSGVYARMEWDKPSPTMTTQCYGFGNGRFGHPEQDRAISLREAAILQSFPADYKFLPNGSAITMKEVGRWIGNAVPVGLAKAIGQFIIDNSRGGDHGRKQLQIRNIA
ncbi:DNA cytosine methyltransferase [Sphingopyxis yananensis]|uniref:DNA cytosine methyltransferase n=1 Tax=Sphingopyxis yananensis TaxID=2886687 RepID=UPI001D0FCA1C|nr:DNA cytosine methyltransferase [Sphingopyxis yananensis]MCC2602550.1 DNA cytosine methyltransferase [Sphingopyxis yananensis]